MEFLGPRWLLAYGYLDFASSGADENSIQEKKMIGWSKQSMRMLPL